MTTLPPLQALEGGAMLYQLARSPKNGSPGSSPTRRVRGIFSGVGANTLLHRSSMWQKNEEAAAL